jgi:hypothetical protein
MSVATPTLSRTRWELPILGVLAVLTFAVIPIGVTTIPGGLPAHPLFLHVPVIFIPLAAIGGLALAAVPRWYAGNAGPWVGLAAVIALGSLNLTMSAGNKLRAALDLVGNGPGPAHLISEHAAAAGKLRVLFIGFVALYLIALAVHATSDGHSSGVPFGDRIFARIRALPGATAALRVLTAGLALASLFYVYRVGDLGAKAVWYTRLHGGA